ncbi:MAG: Na+/H+ antiporter [Kineosporiaceae bacterium]
MLGLELIVVLLSAVLVGNALGRRLRVAPPVLLLAFGVLLGFAPTLREVHLPPEVVLLVFLPALLFWEALNISLQQIRRTLRGIVLVSTLLVILTAAAVAATAHWLGMPWGAAWVLGAAVAPTDATAVAVVSRLIPRRQLTVLRAESLVNDGTALVVFGLAVGVAVGEAHLTPLAVGGHFALAYVGGAVAGLVTAWVTTRARRLLDDLLLENVLAILAPFAAYLLAETVEASGVLAVVVYGLMRGQTGPRQVRADARQVSQAFWSLSTFALNGALFVLVGIEVNSSVRQLTSVDLARGVATVAAVVAVLIVVRIAFLFVSAYAIRAIDRRPSQRLRRVSNRSRVVSGLAGFRGAVSLAAALAVPQTLESGAAFPQRDLVVFVTAGVIVVTLAQGLVLPAVIRWARLPEDTTLEEEISFAYRTAAEEAYAAIPEIARRLDTHEEVLERLLREYDEHLGLLRADPDGDDDELAHLAQHDRDYAALKLELIGLKREAVVRLRDERRIDDDTLRHLTMRLDLEEVRLSRRELVD